MLTGLLEGQRQGTLKCVHTVCVNNFLCKVPVSECLVHARTGCQGYGGQQSQAVAQTQLLRKEESHIVRAWRQSTGLRVWSWRLPEAEGAKLKTL